MRYWDKAGTKEKVAQKQGGAYTVGVLMGKALDGRFWVLDVKRARLDYYAREKLIKETAEADGDKVKIWIEQEGGSGGLESADRTILNLAGHRIYKDRPTGAKEVRAEPFAVQVNGGNVKMIHGEWNHDYLNELMYWPSSKFKDQVDASAGAFMKLTGKKKRAGALRPKRHKEASHA